MAPQYQQPQYQQPTAFGTGKYFGDTVFSPTFNQQLDAANGVMSPAQMQQGMGLEPMLGQANSQFGSYQMPQFQMPEGDYGIEIPGVGPQAGMDVSNFNYQAPQGTDVSQFNEMEQAQLDNLDAQTGLRESAKYGNYANMGANLLGAGFGVASYFDNKKINKQKSKALDQNMRIAQQNRNDRTNFLEGTKSAFA